jgi:hypothetical protein
LPPATSYQLFKNLLTGNRNQKLNQQVVGSNFNFASNLLIFPANCWFSQLIADFPSRLLILHQLAGLE